MVSDTWGWGFFALLFFTLATPSPAALRRADRGHCNKTVDIYEDVSSPAVTTENWGKPLSCWYRFRAFRGTPREWILRVRFKKFKVGVLENATTCSGGYLQVRPLSIVRVQVNTVIVLCGRWMYVVVSSPD